MAGRTALDVIRQTGCKEEGAVLRLGSVREASRKMGHESWGGLEWQMVRGRTCQGTDLLPLIQGPFSQ